MRINSINQPSFKGIVRVNAPINKAYDIVAYKEKTSDIEAKHLRKLLSEKGYDEIEIVDGKDENTSYILTGKEAKLAQDKWMSTNKACDEAGRRYGAGEEFCDAVNDYWASYNNFVQKIINTTKPIAEINVNEEYNSTLIKYLKP